MTITEWYDHHNLESEDRFDALAALYVFCMNYHSGQWSDEYRIMCQIDANLRDRHIDIIAGNTDDDSGEWDNARQHYLELVEKFGG